MDKPQTEPKPDFIPPPLPPEQYRPKPFWHPYGILIQALIVGAMVGWLAFVRISEAVAKFFGFTP